jgi:hypothetical protein
MQNNFELIVFGYANFFDMFSFVTQHFFSLKSFIRARFCCSLSILQLLNNAQPTAERGPVGLEQSKPFHI